MNNSVKEKKLIYLTFQNVGFIYLFLIIKVKFKTQNKVCRNGAALIPLYPAKK